MTTANISLRDLNDAQTHIHGRAEDPVIKASERAEKIRTLLARCYIAVDDRFDYRVGTQRVCETFFCGVYRITRGSQFKRIKAEIRFGSSMQLRKERPATKSMHIEAFWSQYKRYCDHLPAADGKATVYIVPYNDYKGLYKEYLTQCSLENEVHASYQYFLRIHRENFKNIRLLKAKGNFSRCPICIRASNMLSKRSLSPVQRKIVEEYRQLHLERMKLERAVYAEHRSQANEFPERFMAIMFDAMDSSKGDIPKAPKRMTPKNLENMQRMGKHRCVRKPVNRRLLIVYGVCRKPRMGNSVRQSKGIRDVLSNYRRKYQRWDQRRYRHFA